MTTIAANISVRLTPGVTEPLLAGRALVPGEESESRIPPSRPPSGEAESGDDLSTHPNPRKDPEMKLSAEEVRRQMNDPALVAQQIVTDEERRGLHEMGFRPLIDLMVEALASGTGIDTSESDVLAAATLAIKRAERRDLIEGG